MLKQMGYVGVTRADADQVPEAMRILGLLPTPTPSSSPTRAPACSPGDAQGRVGAVHVLMPDDERLRAAMDTTPLVA